MAKIQRKTVSEVIAERDENVGDLPETSRTVERDLSAMQKAGLIRHEGKDNAGV